MAISAKRGLSIVIKMLHITMFVLSCFKTQHRRRHNSCNSFAKCRDNFYSEISKNKFLHQKLTNHTLQIVLEDSSGLFEDQSTDSLIRTRRPIVGFVIPCMLSRLLIFRSWKNVNYFCNRIFFLPTFQ